jgi:hypothetical protein
MILKYAALASKALQALPGSWARLNAPRGGLKPPQDRPAKGRRAYRTETYEA